MNATTHSDALRQFVTAPIRAQTYKRLAYLALAFPLGMAYFLIIVGGSSTGASLLFTIVGIPVLLATLVAATAAAGVEARLSRALLGRETPLPPLLSRPSEWDIDTEHDGYVAAIRHFLTEPTTWTSVGLALLQFGFGLVAFVVLTVGGTTVGALLLAPALYDDPNVSYQTGSYVVTTFPEAVALSALGLLGLLVVCNVCNALAAAGGVLTDTLLSVGRDGETA